MTISNFQTEFNKIASSQSFLLSKETAELRKKAFSEFLKVGLPTKKWEGWQNTDLSKIAKERFRIPEENDNNRLGSNIPNYKIKGTHSIVIYNGYYQKNLSSIPKGVKLLSNLEYQKKNNWEYKSLNSSPFDLLNTSLSNYEFSIIIEPNIDIIEPIQLVFICSGDENLLVSPRLSLDINASSSVTFIERYIGSNNYFLQNTSFFISIDNNAFLEHIRIQSESKKTININNLHVKQNSDSKYNFFQFTNQSELNRSNIYNYVNGKGSECLLNGLTLLEEEEHCDTHIITNHMSPECTSLQNFKFVLNGKSSGVFNGRTIVHEGSQKTDSKQSNKNLLMSNSAVMNSNPQLEIYADDVKCAHGSTTGALDDDALFYLRSRGLNTQVAKSLLIRGFSNELIDTIKNDNLKNFILLKFNDWVEKNTNFKYG